jgi:hypothetical protein
MPAFITAAHTITNFFPLARSCRFSEDGVEVIDVTTEMKFWLATSTDNCGRLLEKSSLREEIKIVRIFIHREYDMAVLVGQCQTFPNLLFQFLSFGEPIIMPVACWKNGAYRHYIWILFHVIQTKERAFRHCSKS